MVLDQSAIDVALLEKGQAIGIGGVDPVAILDVEIGRVEREARQGMGLEVDTDRPAPRLLGADEWTRADLAKNRRKACR